MKSGHLKNKNAILNVLISKNELKVKINIIRKFILFFFKTVLYSRWVHSKGSRHLQTLVLLRAVGVAERIKCCQSIIATFLFSISLIVFLIRLIIFNVGHTVMKRNYCSYVFLSNKTLLPGHPCKFLTQMFKKNIYCSFLITSPPFLIIVLYCSCYPCPLGKIGRNFAPNLLNLGKCFFEERKNILLKISVI